LLFVAVFHEFCVDKQYRANRQYDQCRAADKFFFPGRTMICGRRQPGCDPHQKKCDKYTAYQQLPYFQVTKAEKPRSVAEIGKVGKRKEVAENVEYHGVTNAENSKHSNKKHHGNAFCQTRQHPYDPCKQQGPEYRKQHGSDGEKPNRKQMLVNEPQGEIYYKETKKAQAKVDRCQSPAHQPDFAQT